MILLQLYKIILKERIFKKNSKKQNLYNSFGEIYTDIQRKDCLKKFQHLKVKQQNKIQLIG